MNKFFKYGALSLSASLLVSSFLTTPSSAQEVLSTSPISVEASLITSPASASYNASNTGAPLSYSDGANYLSSLPGVTASRFGGHGLEPFIRGQSQGQLNIISDDSYTFGGCPNRMDPPTAYMNIQEHDTVTIVQGYQSVLNGFGGAGGSVIVEQGTPDFNDTLSATGLIQGGYDGNSEMWNTGANITAGTTLGYADAYGSYKDAGNYEDGNGDEVRSSFTERSGGLKLGYTPEGTHFSLGMDYHKVEDALFPGAGMDSPLAEGKKFKAALEQNLDNDIVQNVKISGYSSLVDHVMDNFSLRTQTAPMPLRVDSESNTYGIKLENDLTLANQPVTTALEWRRNNRNADRIVNTTGALQSLLWPDITINEVGIAGETAYELSQKSRLIVGGRYDYVHVDYGRADVAAPATGNRTANDTYSQFYGITASSKTEHNIGGLLRLEHDYNHDILLYSGLSRSVRTADATERGLANFMGMGGANSWVGNPNIKPEKHHQLDAGFDIGKHGWSFGGSAYANYVEDYILRDSARSQSGILVNLPNADIYRNIDALLTGFEMRGAWQVDQDWMLEADATYTFGANIDAGRALPQIPPLQGKVGIRWQALDYLELAGTTRWAIEQNRVDTNPLLATGRDVDETNGYAVFNLEGTVTEFDPASLTFGVKNIFDTNYTNHLSRSNISDPTEVQVNEPGRSFYVQLSVPF